MNTENKEEILKAVKEKRQISYTNSGLLNSKIGNQWYIIFKMDWKSNFLPIKLSFKNKNKIYL